MLRTSAIAAASVFLLLGSACSSDSDGSSGAGGSAGLGGAGGDGGQAGTGGAAGMGGAGGSSGAGGVGGAGGSSGAGGTGGTAGAACTDACGLPDPPYELVECRTFENVTAAIEVYVVRALEFVFCAGGCSYAPLAYELRLPAETICYADPADITYTNTYHNWNDSIEACTATTCYHLHMVLDWEVTGDWVYTLTMLDAGSGATIDGPYDLVETSATTYP